jgi:hypothetical protein
MSKTPNRRITDDFIRKRIGERYINYQNCEVVIVDYINCENCSVLFDNKFLVTGLQYGDIKRGQVKNPYSPSVFGVGYVGQGKHALSTGKKQTKVYNTWNSFIERSYDEKYHMRCPSYKDVTVCEEWHNFQNFAQWFYENYNPETMQGWQLDKDILIKGNKIYSPETCCFVPQEINTLFSKKQNDLPTGVTKVKNKYRARIHKNGKYKCLGYFNTIKEAFQVYKITKEEWIKEIADKWKNLITEQVYEALINYKIEITD